MIAGLLLVPLLGLLVGGVSGPVLRVLPEPWAADVAAAGGKIPYAALAVPSFRWGCGALSAAAVALVVLAVPSSAWPAWLVLATVGVLLAAVDGLTTWLPTLVTMTGWALVVLTSPLALLTGAPADALRPPLAGLLVGLVFAAGHRLLGDRLMAFGDVRLLPLIGAAGGALSGYDVLRVLLAATLGGAGHAVVRVLRGRRGPFPYAPGLVAGAFGGAALRALGVPPFG